MNHDSSAPAITSNISDQKSTPNSELILILITEFSKPKNFSTLSINLSSDAPTSMSNFVRESMSPSSSTFYSGDANRGPSPPRTEERLTSFTLDVVAEF